MSAVFFKTHSTTREKNLLSFINRKESIGVIQYMPIYNADNTLTDFERLYYNEVALNLLDSNERVIMSLENRMSRLPYSNEQLFTLCIDVMENNKDVSYTYFYPKNNAWYECTVCTYDGTLVIYYKDITTQKLAALEKDKAYLLFQSVFNNEAVGIGMVDDKACFIDANNKLLQILGYSRDELIGKEFNRITIEDDQEQSILLYKSLRNGEIPSYQLEKQYVRKDDTTSWCLISITSIRHTDGSFRCALGIIQDITAIKQIQQEAIDSKNKLTELNEHLKDFNEYKNKLLSLIAHDLRNPFTNCAIIFDLIESQKNVLTRDELYEFSVMLKKSSHKIHVLLNDLIAWAKTQSSDIHVNFRKLNVSTKIKQAIQTLEPGIQNKNVTIEQRLQVNEIMADKEMMLAILRNLIANAVKFSAYGGKIIISSYLINNNVCIEVQDFGVGMSAAVKSTILSKQEGYTSVGTGGEQGSGLGLSIVKDFVERQKGALLIESTEGQGTSFTVQLPA